MPRLRVLQAVVCLGSLGLSACAAAVPWPPQDGSCIEARHGRGKGATWHYRIHGQAVPRVDVEQMIDTSPIEHGRVRRSSSLGYLGPGLLLGGLPPWFGGIVSAGITGRPALLLIAAGGMGMFTAGILVIMSADDPFRRAVVDYNESVAKLGGCQSPAEGWIPPAVPRPAPPVEDFAPPRYGPRPLAP